MTLTLTELASLVIGAPILVFFALPRRTYGKRSGK